MGATPLAITDNLNFGNPERAETMGEIVGAIDGIAEACTALAFPVVSGNCSLYNETNGEGILPTPAIGGVGLLKDASKHATLDFKRDGDVIILIGETRGHLGQSIYLREIEGKEEGGAPLGKEVSQLQSQRRAVELDRDVEPAHGQVGLEQPTDREHRRRPHHGSEQS